MSYSKINFTPGPSQLYFTVEDHMKQAFRDGIPSLSHRSKKFESIYAEAVSGLRQLLNLPSDYHIYFTGSATEIWERTVQNLVGETSFHLVNGSFSKRFFEISAQLGKNAKKLEVAAGEGFSLPLEVPPLTELIAVTHNETSTGVSLPLDFIYSFKINIQMHCWSLMQYHPFPIPTLIIRNWIRFSFQYKRDSDYQQASEYGW